MPSNSILVQKQQLVADLAEQIKNSEAGVVVNYQGITVDKDTAMRKALREAGVKYVVMKNTMTGRACDMVGYGDMKQYLTGMTAIAISENDPVIAAKILKEYADKIESFNILAGYVDGAVVDAATVNALAEIPTRKLLLQSSSALSSLLCTSSLTLSRLFATRTARPPKRLPQKHNFCLSSLCRTPIPCLT